MEWVIYCHTNKENNKKYIGLSKNINKRWRNGLGYLNNHHKVFAAAIQKYGGIEAWNTAWIHEIIEDKIDSIEKANEREKYWIAYYHTYVGDPNCHGYNCTIGGDGSNGHIMSEAEKEWRRQKRLGTTLSESTRQKMSIARKGKKQHLTEKKLAALHNAAQAMATKNRKKVYCTETNTIYISITEASNKTGIPKETISACCHGRQKTAWGMHWKIIKEEN